jgi:hypothetical protein
MTSELLRFYDGRARDLRAAAQAAVLQHVFRMPLAALRLLLSSLLTADSSQRSP